jgi:molybdate transport system substrate-binding protein
MKALFAVVRSLASPATAPEALRVFAAASLSDAFREVAALYEAEHPGERVELAFAGSQVLRTQIEHGAVADVFASADLDHAQALQASGLLGSTQVFARNRLVVVVAPAAADRVARVEDLAAPGIKLVVAGPAVPAGRYASRLLAKLGASLGPDFVRRVESNVASQETNVRAVLSKVALGEADAGFVYASDAKTTAVLRVLEVPAAAQVVAEYPVGVLSRSPRAARAHAFVALLLGPAGGAILRQHGFSP